MLRVSRRDPRQGLLEFMAMPFAAPAEILPPPPLFLVPLPEATCTVVTEDLLVDEPLTPEVLASAPEEPAGPPYRELDWILAEAATKPFPVAIFKIGHKWVSVVAYSLAAAARLETYKRSHAEEVAEKRRLHSDIHPHDLTLGASCLRMCLPLATKPHGYSPHFALYDMVAPRVEDSFLYRHLAAAGFNVIVSPSLRRFAEREARRMERENTAFDMPEFVDGRPLYDRIETGVALRCDKAVGEFEAGKFYLVTTAGAEDDFIRLHPLDTGEQKPKALNWGPTDGALEEHFTETVETGKVYDPATSVVAKFPGLIEMHNKKLDSLGFREKLFLHAQYDAVQAAVKDHVYFGHPMRMGKAQPLDAKLLTPTGWKLMGDIKEGHLVFGSSGKPQEVTGVFPQGIKEVFQVEFGDGSTTQCCGDHLWQVKQPWRKYLGLKPLVLSLNQLVTKGLFDKAGNAKFFIPLVQPIEFPEKRVPMDPYAIGLLLGDGTLGGDANGHGSPVFTSDDVELVSAVGQALPDGMKATHQGAGCGYRLSTPGAKGGCNGLSPLKVMFSSLDIRHKAEGKFIPDAYKFGSVEQRRRLLSGLLDSDGGPWEQKNPGIATVNEFSSASERLADDVRFLVQSLGGKATKSSRIPSYTYNGEKRQGQRSCRIRISFGPGWNPFLLKRKADIYRPCTKFLPTRAIVSVKSIGYKPCQCISVAGPDGLYVTDDFILTHNTSLALAWTQLKGSQRIGILSSKNVRQVIAKEARRMEIPGVVIVNSLADLEQEGRYFLLTYDWLKGTGRGGVKDTKKGHNFAYPALRNCPYCDQPLVRPVRAAGLVAAIQANLPAPADSVAPGAATANYTPHYGYICRNQACTYSPKHYSKTTAKKEGGAAWSDVAPRVLKHYVDLDRAQHWIKCVRPIYLRHEKSEDAEKQIAGLFEGRCCRECGYIAAAYTPMRARRVRRRRWGTWAVDEIHNMKSGYGTDQAKAFLTLRAKHMAGLSGTLMPNAPEDPYWPLHWMFQGGSYRFPYFRTGDNGLRQYRNDFTSVTYIYDEDNNVTGKKATPYLKSVGKFHQLMAPKMLRRAYTDPLVIQSLEAAGLKMPEIDYQILRVEPTQEQAKLMVASINLFQQHFERYKAEGQAEAEAAGRAFTLNASRVLPLMMRLRVAATVPDRFNLQLAKLGIKEPIYTGQPGGAKLPLIVDLVNAKVRQGQKVVIFSFFKEMQRLLGEHLAHHNPIVFQTSWSEDERFEAIESFHTDDSKKLTIGSPLSFGEGVDLSPADVCICSDLLWVPGKMAQAWSRILKALPQDRKCEIYRVLLHHSIDEHMWNIFYAKTVAQEQAFDRRIVTRRETAIDIQAFVDMVLASRTEINELLIEDRGEEELVYTPLVSMLSRIDERD